MGRSVSYPADAQIAFRTFDPDQPEDADSEHETPCDNILTHACAAFPSFDPGKDWRGREDRILLRNCYADIGISAYGCIAAIWIAERPQLITPVQGPGPHKHDKPPSLSAPMGILT